MNNALEKGGIPPGRNFLEAAKGTLRGSRRESLIQPGDYLEMPVVVFASWHGGAPLDPLEQERQGLTGVTRVEVGEIIDSRNTERRREVVLKSDRDKPDRVRQPVSASLLSGFGAPYWWQGHLVYGPHVS